MLAGLIHLHKTIKRGRTRIRVSPAGASGSVKLAPQLRLGLSTSKGLYLSVFGRVIPLARLVNK